MGMFHESLFFRLEHRAPGTASWLDSAQPASLLSVRKMDITRTALAYRYDGAGMKRPPDFVIGPKDNPYLCRWWVIPRNRFFNIYLHHIRANDDDRALHDHPWWNVSILLKGSYREIRNNSIKIHKRWSIVFRKASTAHRLELPVINGGITYCWSLFITGPVIREWGFHCPKGWRHWKQFVDERDSGQVGRGCE